MKASVKWAMIVPMVADTAPQEEEELRLPATVPAPIHRLPFPVVDGKYDPEMVVRFRRQYHRDVDRATPGRERQQALVMLGLFEHSIYQLEVEAPR